MHRVPLESKVALIAGIKRLSLPQLRELKEVLRTEYPQTLRDVNETKFQLRLDALNQETFNTLLLRVNDMQSHMTDLPVPLSSSPPKSEPLPAPPSSSPLPPPQLNDPHHPLSNYPPAKPPKESELPNNVPVLHDPPQSKKESKSEPEAESRKESEPEAKSRKESEREQAQEQAQEQKEEREQERKKEHKQEEQDKEEKVEPMQDTGVETERMSESREHK